MPKFSAVTAAAIVLLLFPGIPAFGGAGVPADDQTNQNMNTFPRPDLSNNATVREESDYDAGRRFMRHRQYTDAITHLELALADKPQDADLLYDLGLAKRMTGDYDGALYYLGRAIAIAPDNRDAHESLGEAYLGKNDLSSAQKELSTLTSLCASGCDQREALSQAIASYKPPVASAGGVPATTSAAPAPGQP
jgi:tetratricopeptide (TPR) repeat protein